MTRSKQRTHCQHSCGMCDPGKREPGTAKPSDQRRMQDDSRCGETVYMVAKPHHVARAHVADGGGTSTNWLPEPKFGQHAENIDAMRAFVEVIDPRFVGASDDTIRREFGALSRNCGMAKIVRVSADDEGGHR